MFNQLYKKIMFPRFIIHMCELSIHFLHLFAYFFPFLATPRHMEFLGQGSNPNCSCDLCHGCGNAESFNPALDQVSNLHPGTTEMPPILLHHHRNSYLGIIYNYLSIWKYKPSYIQFYCLFLLCQFWGLHPHVTFIITLIYSASSTT